MLSVLKRIKSGNISTCYVSIPHIFKLDHPIRLGNASSYLKIANSSGIHMKKWLSIISLFFIFSLSTSIAIASDPLKNALSNLQQDEEFLPRDEAFQFSADLDENQLYIRWKIADGYYLYKKRFHFKVEGAVLGQAVYPQGEMKYDENFEEELEVFHHFIEVHIPLTQLQQKITLTAGYQGCAEKGLCYTPTEKTLSFDVEKKFVSAVTATSTATSTAAVEFSDPTSKNTRLKNLSNDQQAVANYLKDSNAIIAVGLFLLLGLGLTFTPCVFPMMPIIASIIAGQDKPSTSKTFWLSFTYVQGMALTYVLLGLLTAFVGHSLAGFFQSTAVILGAALIFILLAFSMFGFYELALPSKLQSKLTGLSNSQTGGTFIGVFIMGAISALIVSPCITAPLSGALIHIANTGNYLFGALAMYALAMGMGIPLILIGMSEGKLMLKAGNWMNGVKSAFGVSLLAVALIISDHLIPGPILLILWGLLAMGSGVYLGALNFQTTQGWQTLWKALGFSLVITGTIYFVGAAQGNGDPLKPLAQNTYKTLTQKASRSMFNKVSNENSTSIQADADGTIAAENIYANLMRQVAKANANGKTVMVDLYADWCTACEEFAREVFPEENVQAALANTVWLQIDLTESNPANNLFMKKLGVLGLPSILFFNLKGEENPQNRVTGFMDSNDFVERIHQAFKDKP